MISKEKFIKYMKVLKCIHQEQDNLNDALKAISPDFGGFCNEKAIDTIIEMLKDLTNDGDSYDSDIEYFIYELNWGKDYKDGCICYQDMSGKKHNIKMSNFEELYDELVRKNDNYKEFEK